MSQLKATSMKTMKAQAAAVGAGPDLPVVSEISTSAPPQGSYPDVDKPLKGLASGS